MLQKIRQLPLLLLSALAIGCTTAKTMTPQIELKSKAPVFPLSDPVLTGILESRPQFFAEALRNRDAWRIQIIYTQIDRNEKNEPRFTHRYFHVDPNRYFYPASTVKMPAAALALQKLNEQKIPGLNRNTAFLTDSASPGQTAVDRDTSSADGRPSVAHYIKKIFLVSDNDAYNRLYEFLGQDYLNRSLHNMGYDGVALRHRLQLPLGDEQNRLTNPVRFVDGGDRVIYEQPAQKSTLFFPEQSIRLGTGYLRNGSLVAGPFDFSEKNRITLPELHSILQSLIFPETVPAKSRFNLTENDYRFLYRCMSMKPSESDHPRYGPSYSDAYVKFLLFGGSGSINNPALRIFNKVGDAYGFLQDVAYVVDWEKGIEFMLSATIYCNGDGIFNDDKYDYDTIGFPFLKHLGEAVYDFEARRPKKFRPDLSRFKIDYGRPD